MRICPPPGYPPSAPQVQERPLPDPTPAPETPRAAAAALLRALSEQGLDPEVHPAPVVRRAGLVALTHALLSAAFGALPLPLLGLLGLGATLWSWSVEAEGGAGWARRLVPRQIGHNVVCWGRRPRQPPSRPCLLIATPFEGGTAPRPTPRVLVGLAAAPTVFLALAQILRVVWPAAAPPLQLWGLAGAGLVAVISAIYALSRGVSLLPARAALALQAAAGLLTQHETLDVVLAWVGGGHSADGLALLLQNHRHRLDPSCTRVLYLAPEEDGPALLSPEGRLRPAPADPALGDALRAVGLAERPGLSGASRARHLGWRAAGVAGGPGPSPELLRRAVAALAPPGEAAP